MNTAYHLDEILKHERQLTNTVRLPQSALDYHTQQISYHKKRRERLIGIIRIQRRHANEYWPLQILYTFYATISIARRDRIYGIYKITRRHEQN